MRTLVVGGGGYFGGHVVDGIERVDGLTCSIGRRRGGAGAVRVDVTDAATFSAMGDFDVVVNTTNSLTANPVEAMRYCLRSGIVWLETSADLATIERSYFGLKKFRNAEEPSPGAIVLGAGLFPGLSNLLAKELAEELGSVSRLELAYQLTALAAGGEGMVDLMVDSLMTNLVRYEGGERVEAPPIGRGIDVCFDPLKRREATVRVGFAEAVMLHWSLGVASTATYMAPQPSLLRGLLRLTSHFARPGWFGAGAVRAGLRVAFFVMRRVLFSWRRTGVSIVALANRHGDQGYHAHERFMRFDDGIAAGGLAVAAMVSSLAHRASPPRGLLCVEEVFDLSDIIERMRTLDADIVAGGRAVGGG